MKIKQLQLPNQDGKLSMQKRKKKYKKKNIEIKKIIKEIYKKLTLIIRIYLRRIV